LGFMPLREEISHYLYRSRGIACSTEQVQIVAGLPQALHLIARCHIERGDLVAVEEPTYPPMIETFRLHGASLFPVPVDGSGAIVDRLTEVGQKIRLMYTTPTHQFPTGSALNLARRIKLLSWAREAGSLIVEDEHDSEFSIDRPTPALKALD